MKNAIKIIREWRNVYRQRAFLKVAREWWKEHPGDAISGNFLNNPHYPIFTDYNELVKAVKAGKA